MTTSDDARTTAAQLRALADFGMPPESIEAFRLLARIGGPFAEVTDLLDRHERLIADAASNMDALGQRGWGLASLPVAEQTRARALLEADQPDQADALLADLWDDDRRTGRVVARVSTLGAADPAFRELSLHRRRLLAKARHHHHAGAYEASVPIVLAQVDTVRQAACADLLIVSTGSLKMPRQQAVHNNLVRTRHSSRRRPLRPPGPARKLLPGRRCVAPRRGALRGSAPTTWRSRLSRSTQVAGEMKGGTQPRCQISLSRHPAACAAVAIARRHDPDRDGHMQQIGLPVPCVAARG